MILPRFNAPLATKGTPKIDMIRLQQVKGLLQRRYKQTHIAEMLGMSNSALSDFMAYHGLRKPK